MNRLSPDSLEPALTALASFLEADRAAHETLVVIGGGALIALGIVSRTTKDVDIMAAVDPERGLVDPAYVASVAVGGGESCPGNAARSALAQYRPGRSGAGRLPEGFLSRLTRHDYGACLTICLPDRLDLVHLKLFAIMDQGPARHVTDLKALKPHGR